MNPTTSGAPSVRSSPGEAIAERALWNSRLLMIVGVAGSTLMALIVLWMSAVDLVVLAGDAIDYASATDRSDVRAELIGGIVKTIDSFLLAAILVLVSLGLYELFISRLDPARDGATSPRILLVLSIDDLKDRIAKWSCPGSVDTGFRLIRLPGWQRRSRRGCGGRGRLGGGCGCRRPRCSRTGWSASRSG